MKNRIIINLCSVITILSILFFIRVSYVGSVLSFLIIVVLSYSKLSLKSSNLFSSNLPIFNVFGISSIYAALIIIINFSLIGPIIEIFTEKPINYGAFNQVKDNSKLLFISLGIGWVVGGLLEETIFRGYIFETLEKILPKRIGLIISLLFTSFIFGYLHNYQGITGQILNGVTGGFLALIYIYHKRNLWVSIITHGLINTFGLTLLYFNLI